MQLPLEVLFEPPTRNELQRAWRPACAAVATAVILSLAAIAGREKLSFPVNTAVVSGKGTLQVDSVPPAAIEIDGQQRGRTPADLAIIPGAHRVRLQAPGHASATYDVDVPDGGKLSIAAELWLQTSRTEQLRPPLPGAAIANAAFLLNGDVALLLALPSSTERQLWILPRNGHAERVGPARSDGPLAISSDGNLVAYLGPAQGSRSVATRLEEVWITSRTGGQGRRAWALPASARDQALLDLIWAPDNHHVLLVSRQQNAMGGIQSRLLWLDASRAEPEELLVLPGEVVSGSYEWAPDGSRVAFLIRTPQGTSLCLLEVGNGEFRYLGDVRRSDSAPLAFSPVAWAADAQHLAYAALAPSSTAGSWGLFGSGPRTALFVSDLGAPAARLLGKAEGQSPAWRRDGGIVALAEPKTGRSLTVRIFDQQGKAEDLINIPVNPGAGYAARWDLDHAQALIATRSSATGSGPRIDYWLVRFQQEIVP